GEWCFPGGHLDFGETVFECAIRETKEEVGIEVRNCRIISIADEMRYVQTDDKHYLNIGVLAEHIGGEPKLLEPEKCKEWRWFSLENIPKNMLEGTNWIIANYKAKRLYRPAR
ncbi:MAG: NUDIX domain-containing protein, partial [bacterium]